MDFNWDQIEAYNRPSDDLEPMRLEACNATKIRTHPNKHMTTITALASEGQSKTNVAKVLGISIQRVSQLAKKNNVKFAADNAKNLSWKKMTYRVGVYARQGCTAKEVASILQVGEQEVLDFAIENRIVFRAPNGVRELLG